LLAFRVGQPHITSKDFADPLVEAPREMKEILADRFIYQGLRHAGIRHAVRDQSVCPGYSSSG
jgi:hypothetical protein